MKYVGTRAARMRGRAIVSAIAVVATIALAGCGSSGSTSSSAATGNGPASTSTASAGESTSSSTASAGQSASISGLKVAVANPSQASPEFILFANGVQTAAKTTGVNLQSYNNNEDAATTIKNAQLIAQTKPNYVFEYNPIAGAYTALQATFQRAGVRCIAVNTPPSDPSTSYCKWFNLSNPVVCGDTGKAVGMVAQKDGWTGSDTTVLLVNAAAFGQQLNSCLGYFYQDLTNYVPGLQKVANANAITLTTSKLGTSMVQVNGQGASDPSFKVTQQALQTIPANRHIVVYSVADDSSLGAWKAIQRAGRGGDALVAGIAGEPAAIQQLYTNPRWVAEGDVFFGQWGEYLTAMMAAMKSGVNPPFQTLTPEGVLTKNFSIPGSTVAPVGTFFHQGATVPYRLPPLQTDGVGETVFGQQSVGNGYLAATGVLQQFHNVEGLGG